MSLKSRGDKIFDVLNGVFFAIASLVFLLPFWTILVSSFLGQEESARRGAYQLYLEKIDFTAYELLLSRGSSIYNAYGTTITLIIVGTLINLMLTIPLSYGLSKSNLPGKKWMTFFVFFTMLFSGGMVPSYLLVTNLGLKNTLWALILPGAISAWNTILMRNFFQSIPSSLEESAEIDGASIITILVRIILPLSTPAIATIGMFYAVGHWDSWFGAVLYISDHTKYPLQLVLRNIVYASSVRDINADAIYDMGFLPPSETFKSAAIIVATVPVLFIYPFVQKYFVKGIMVGSVKG